MQVVDKRVAFFYLVEVFGHKDVAPARQKSAFSTAVDGRDVPVWSHIGGIKAVAMLHVHATMAIGQGWDEDQALGVLQTELACDSPLHPGELQFCIVVAGDDDDAIVAFVRRTGSVG